MYAKRSTTQHRIRTHHTAQRYRYKAPVLTTPMLPKDSYEGKVAFVTGGGTGLGRGIATRLSELGATVVIASRRQDVIDAAAKEIEGETGGRVVGYGLDVRDPERVKEVVDRIVSDVGLPGMFGGFFSFGGFEVGEILDLF